MTRSYEAADKSHLENRSDFAIALAFQEISALFELNLLLFWGLFSSLRFVPCCKGCACLTALVSRRLSPAPAHHQNVCCDGLEGLPVFQAQGTSVEPAAAFTPATDKFRGQSLSLSLG